MAVDDRGLFNALSDGYKSFTDKQTVQINDNLQNVKVLTLFDNYSFVSLIGYFVYIVVIARFTIESESQRALDGTADGNFKRQTV